MKIAMKSLVRDEKGQALVLVLILLLVGGLIIAPLLAYMGTGLIAGKVYERRTDELYAADAGVEDAVWKIQHQVDEVKALTQCYQSTNYTISDVNGKTVDVTLTLMTLSNDPFDYRVVSTATGDGSGTQIEAYVTSVYGDYSGITNQVITSRGEIDIKNADVTPLEGENAPVEYYTGDWPTADELAQYYWQYVKDETPYDSDTIDINGVDMDLGPLYRDGELDIKNSSNDAATLTLTETIYITGDTLIGTTGKDFTLDLKGHTIFVESDSADPQKALWIGGKCTVIGPGVIIAVGDIFFSPNIEAGMTAPIFIMSIEGTTQLNPGGDFYGSVAGSVEVDLQPGTTLNYPEGGFVDLNFPGCSGAKIIYGIASWDMSQQ